MPYTSVNLSILNVIIQYIEESSLVHETKSIWIVGSSIMKQAFTVARRSFDEANLGLKRHNYRVWWQGKGGMVLEQLLPRITFLLQIETAPDILVIHCGGNNIGKSKLHTLRKEIKEAMLIIHEMLPFTHIVWSQILPRSEWRYSRNCKAMNHAATRVNNFAASLCVQLGGSYLKYPEISWDTPEMFAVDGVHMSPMGNNILLFHLQNILFSLTARN